MSHCIYGINDMGHHYTFCDSILILDTNKPLGLFISIPIFVLHVRHCSGCCCDVRCEHFAYDTPHHNICSRLHWPCPANIIKTYETTINCIAYGFTLIPTWIGNNTHSNVWNEFTYLFPNFSGRTVEVWEWISNFVAHFIGHVIIYPYWDWKQSI